MVSGNKGIKKVFNLYITEKFRGCIPYDSQRDGNVLIEEEVKNVYAWNRLAEGPG